MKIDRRNFLKASSVTMPVVGQDSGRPQYGSIFSEQRNSNISNTNTEEYFKYHRYFDDAMKASNNKAIKISTIAHHDLSFGGGAFYLSDDSIGEPSTGNVFKFYDADGRGFVISENEVTPSMFGGEGGVSTDSSDAIQLAIDSGIPVKFDEEYSIAKSIRIPKGRRVSIAGQGWSTGIKVNAEMTSALVYDSDESVFGNYFSNFSINCHGLADIGLRFQRGKSWRLDRLLIRNFNTHGCWFSYPGAKGATWYEMEMLGCKIDGSRRRAKSGTAPSYGVYLDDGATDSTIAGTVIAYTSMHAIHVNSGANRIDASHVYGGSRIGIWYSAVIHVNGTYFDTCTECCVYSNSSGGEFSGCLFHSNKGSPFHSDNCFVYGSSGKFGVLIRDGTSKRLAGLIVPGIKLGERSIVDVYEIKNSSEMNAALYMSDLILRRDSPGDRQLSIDSWGSGSSRIVFQSDSDDIYEILKESDKSMVTHSVYIDKKKSKALVFDLEHKEMHSVLPHRLSAGVCFHDAEKSITSPISVVGSLGEHASSEDVKEAIRSVILALESYGLVKDETD